MRLLWRGAPALAVVGALACGDATSVEPSALEGTWVATSAIIRSVANPAVAADLVALGGGLSVTVSSGSQVSVTVTDTDGATQTSTGTIQTTGDTVTLTILGRPASGTIARNGDTLTLDLTTGVEFDFDDDGNDEDATLSATFTRS